MFLLQRLQTIPSQTALSGANPISRRIAERSACEGVRARRGKGATLPAASLAPLALRGPAEQSGEVLGEAPPRKQISPFKQRPSRGAGDSPGAPQGRSAGARPLTGREGLGGRSPAGLTKRRASSLPACSPGTGLPRTHARHPGGRGPERLRSQNRVLLLYHTEAMR